MERICAHREAGDGDGTGREDAAIPARAEQIIAAAQRLLNENGLDGLTVRAVLNATGFNRRAFYEHFADKDEMVLAVFARSIALAATYCRERIATLPDPLTRLRFIVEYLVLGDASGSGAFDRNARRGSALCREHMRLAESRPADLHFTLRPLVQLIAEQLSDGMARGDVRRDDPVDLARLMYNLVSTTVHAAILAQEVGDPAPDQQARQARQIWAFCLGGLKP